MQNTLTFGLAIPAEYRLCYSRERNFPTLGNQHPTPDPPPLGQLNIPAYDRVTRREDGPNLASVRNGPWLKCDEQDRPQSPEALSVKE